MKRRPHHKVTGFVVLALTAPVLIVVSFVLKMSEFLV